MSSQPHIRPLTTSAKTAQRQGLARGAAVSVHLTSAEKVIVFSRGDSGGWRGGWPPRERSRPWCPSALQDGLRGQEQRRNGPSSQAALEREGLDASMTQRNPAICSKYEPPRPCPLGTPGPHTCSDTGGSPRATTVPSVLHRISRDRIPAPHRRPRVPGPAGPGTHGHLRVTPRSAWWEPGSVSKVAATPRPKPRRGRILPTRVGVLGSAEHSAALASPRAQGARSLRPGVRPFRCLRGGGVSKPFARICGVFPGLQLQCN